MPTLTVRKLLEMLESSKLVDWKDSGSSDEVKIVFSVVDFWKAFIGWFQVSLKDLVLSDINVPGKIYNI